MKSSMSQPPRARRLRVASALYERFTRSTHFHPDFQFSRTSRFVSARIVLWSAAFFAVVFYAMVAGADIGIFRHHADNRFTKVMERVFPYPAAVVGQDVVPLSRFRKEVNARIVYSQKHQQSASLKDVESLVANQLVNKAMYAQEISKYKISVSTADVDASLQDIYKQVGGSDKLNAYIKDNYGSSITLADFRLWIQESLVESAIQHQILQRAEVSHILLAVPADATPDQVETIRKKVLDIKSKVTDVTSFAAAAKQYSEDVSSRDKGGSLGITVRGDDKPVISADFQNAVFSLPVGQVSDPIKSSFGWHLILVTSREGSVDKSMKQYTLDLRATYKPKMFIGN